MCDLAPFLDAKRKQEAVDAALCLQSCVLKCSPCSSLNPLALVKWHFSPCQRNGVNVVCVMKLYAGPLTN